MITTSRQWLRALRTKKGLRQIDIANAVGISIQQYSFIETGYRNPSNTVAKKIATFLDFPWTLFYEDMEYTE